LLPALAQKSKTAPRFIFDFTHSLGNNIPGNCLLLTINCRLPTSDYPLPMLSYGDLKKGVTFVWNGQPYQVLDSGFLRMQQRKAVMQTKIKNLITGKIVDQNWQASDSFEEAEVERKRSIFIYASKGEYWFHEEGDKSKRFSLKEEVMGEAGRFLKAGTEVITFVWNGKVIQAEPPIKMTLEVTEAPPAIRGNTAQGGTKQVVLETGATVNTPLFIESGDKIVVNTQTGDYVERA